MEIHICSVDLTYTCIELYFGLLFTFLLEKYKYHTLEFDLRNKGYNLSDMEETFFRGWKKWCLQSNNVIGE